MAGREDKSTDAAVRQMLDKAERPIPDLPDIVELG